ncbi:MAG TPA: cohesin domain-containing protein, partial [Terriglobales bacterium]|nr:cohesin domain-containing protein [Terriglobales bacterium]
LRTQELIDKGKSPQSAKPQGSELSAAGAEGPVELAPISNQPITLKMSEDAKTAYMTIGKLAGVNVLFDPDYVSRRVTIDLNNVSLQQALEIVALESKTFWRPITPNTILVATDNKTKRTELEQNVVKTIYLSNLSQATELQDAINVLRTVIGMQRVIQVPSQNAVVMRGTPDQVALAEKLIGDIDKAHPEVLVDVAVMQVNRDRIRDLGINPPQTASVTLNSNVTTTNSSNTSGGTTTGTGTTATPATNNGISLNQLGSLDANNFSVVIPQASVSFLFSDNNTHIIQNPQIRAVNGQKASLKIGDKVPIATGSFQPGIGGVGINPLVNTQFQYTDVGVIMDITPTVHGDDEVTLKLHMEISSITSHVTIGGIDQPVIGQRTIDHEIRLKNGEVNLLGGIFEDDYVNNLSGFPFLSQIPLLRYLFSQNHKQVTHNEIVFALVPHIVRSQSVDDLNARAIDVGTENTIDLRRAPAASPAESAAATPPRVTAPPAPPQVPQQALAPAQQPQQPAALPAQPTQVPPQPGAPAQAPPGSAPPGQAQNHAQAQQPQANLSNASAILSFDPPQITQPTGSTFAVNVVVSGGQNIYSVPLQISYDPRQVQLLNISNGGFLSRDGQAVALVHREDPVGNLQITATRPPNSGGVSGQGAVLTLTFMAKAAGQSTLNIVRAGARDANMQPIPVSGGQAMVTVK